MKIDDAVEIVLKHEGGYVNDKKDPGGETNMGISKRAYPHIDIKNLTKSDAKKIYYKDYWLKPKVNVIPNNLKYIYFDMCVNMGKGRAVKIIQEACNAKGSSLKIDGGLGPKTLSAIRKTKLSEGRVKAYRVKYYVNLIAKKPSLEKFYYGWYKRAIS